MLRCRGALGVAVTVGALALLDSAAELPAGEPGLVVESAHVDLDLGLLTIRGRDFGAEPPQVFLGETELALTSASPTLLEAALPGSFSPASLLLTLRPASGGRPTTFVVTTGPGGDPVTSVEALAGLPCTGGGQPGTTQLVRDAMDSITFRCETAPPAAGPEDVAPLTVANPRRLAVTRVVADTLAGTVIIMGQGFGPDPPVVVLDGVEVAVSSFIDEAVGIQLAAPLDPGTHRLTLRRSSPRAQASFVVAVDGGEALLPSIDALSGVLCDLDGLPGRLVVTTDPGGDVAFRCQPAPTGPADAAAVIGPPGGPRPVITGVLVDSTAGTLRIEGSNFTPGATVTLGGVELPVVVDSSNFLEALLPVSLLPGSHLLTLSHPAVRGEASFVVLVGTGGPPLPSIDALNGLACTRDGFGGTIEMTSDPTGDLSFHCEYCYQSIDPSLDITREAVAFVLDRMGTTVDIPEQCATNPTLGCGSGGAQLMVSPGTIQTSPTMNPTILSFAVPLEVHTTAPVTVAYDTGAIIIECSADLDTTAGSSTTVTLNGEAEFVSQAGNGVFDRVNLGGLTVDGLENADFTLSGSVICGAADVIIDSLLPQVQGYIEASLERFLAIGLCLGCGSTELAICPSQ